MSMAVALPLVNRVHKFSSPAAALALERDG
jgi:hypothetical protein